MKREKNAERRVVRTVLAALLCVTMCGIMCSAMPTGTAFAAGESSGNGEAVSMDFAGAEFSVSPKIAVYTGSIITPKVSISMNGKVLSEGSDYTIVIPEMKNAGLYFIGIGAKGSYTGNSMIQYVVNPVDLKQATIGIQRDITSADLTEDQMSVKPDVLKRIITVTQSGTDITNRCEISAAVTSVSGVSAVEVKAAISNGDGVNIINSSVTKIFPLKISLTDCQIGELDTQIYSGEAITPDVVIYDPLTKETLVKNVDYTLTYKNNKDVGYALVTATGMGRYSGTTGSYFKIDPKDLHNCTSFFTNGRASSAFTGKNIEPLVTVRDGVKSVLVANKDYYIAYLTSDNKVVQSIRDVGEYRVMISGVNNYTGQVMLDFQVSGVDIKNYDVKLRYSSVKADGSAKVPEITSVKLGVTSALTAADYDVTYLDEDGNEVTELVKPGTYTVVVSGKNGYAGQTYAKFKIAGEQQTIKLSKTTYKVYSKSKDFTLKPSADGDGDGFVFESSDPSVASVSEYGKVSIHKLGRAKITIKTTGNSVYEQATKSVVIKVYPYKSVMTRTPWTDGAKKSFKVRWNTQDDVTYYQVRYSTTKSFKSGTYKTKKVNASSKNYSTQSTTIKSLKSGTRYYVRVRAVKVVENDDGDKLYYYGNWSDTKSVKTK